MRVFEILDEIIDAVEAAKGVPMSASAIINRPMLLDLLDDLRDAFPQSMEEAREILEERDEIIDSAKTEAGRLEQMTTSDSNRIMSDARAAADETVSSANAQAETALARARAEADRIISSAEAQAQATESRAAAEAERTVAAGQHEHERLVSQHEVHRAAVASADQVTEEAVRKSAKLRGDADKYVDDTLSELHLTLQKLSATVERGREAMHDRRSGAATPYGRHESVYDQDHR